MEYFVLKLLPFFLVYFSTFCKQIHCQIGPNLTLNSVVKNDNYLKFEKNFDQETTIKTGDVMECEVLKTNSEEPINNDIHVFTQDSPTTSGYVSYPASKDKKCFSFQVRTTAIPQILLSATPAVVEGQKLEVILQQNGNSGIRTKDGNYPSTTPIKGIFNDKELRGFWIRWLDDYLLEVGRDTDNYPILSYRLPEKLSVNFIAILSVNNFAEWILHEDPHCGAYNITKKIKVETKCKVGTTKINSEKINFLQKSQQHILHQIKNQHEISKVNSLRSKEILLVYQQLIEKLYRNAEENQNQIYAEDNEVYSPLQSITFDEITQEYLQFMAELQMELAMFKQISAKINSTNSGILEN